MKRIPYPTRTRANAGAILIVAATFWLIAMLLRQ
jgi:hypothetical protein